MRLTQIQQILEIEKCTSISQAARNLYISQPALSSLLNDFENEIGVQIFTRTKSGIKPTENGSYILESMKKIMHEIDYIQNYASVQEELSGNFSLMIGCAYEFLYADLIMRFKQNFPKAHLIPHNIFSFKAQDKVYKGLLDAAIIAIYQENGTHLSMEHNSQKNVAIYPLKHCHSYVVMNNIHPKSSLEVMPVSELTAEQLIIGRQFEIDVLIEQLSLKKYPVSDIDRLTILELLDYNTAIYLDASPLSLEQYKTSYPGYKVLPVVNDCSSLIENIYFEWPVYFIHRIHQNSRLQQLFIEEIRSILQQYNLFINE